MSQIRISRVFAVRRIFELKMFDDKSRAEIFNQYRRRLFGIAYRMLGARADAEDIVQEAYPRWHKTRTEEIETRGQLYGTKALSRLGVARLSVLHGTRASRARMGGEFDAHRRGRRPRSRRRFRAGAKTIQRTGID